MSEWDDFFAKKPRKAANPGDSTPITNDKKALLITKLKERQSRVHEQTPISQLQRLPNNPLHSVSSFTDLPLRPELRRALTSLDYIRPSKIQGLALPKLLHDPPFNLIAQSQSGTGKTATFAMAMLNRVDVDAKYVQCICLTPTFELAIQVGQVIERLGQHIRGLKVFYAVRQTQVNSFFIGDHVVVGTPGKLLNLLEVNRVLDLSRLKVFVLDEADLLIEQGESTRAVDICRMVPSTCQFLMFSATYSEGMLRLGKEMTADAEVIRLERPELALENIDQHYIWCETEEEKIGAIKCIYENMGIDKAIIFCNTVSQSNLLFNFFVQLGYQVVVINSSYDVKQRSDELLKFKKGAHVLISTNVAARGLDILGVRIVINFEVPVKMDEPDYDSYLHRIGRSGRFGDLGYSFTFISSKKELDLIEKIGYYFGKPIKELKAGDSKAIQNMAE